MTALTHAAEYAAVREAIQQLTTLDSNGNRRDVVSFSVGELTVSYAASQLEWLQKRELELVRRLSRKNARKRTTPDFSSDEGSGFEVVI